MRFMDAMNPTPAGWTPAALRPFDTIGGQRMSWSQRSSGAITSSRPTRSGGIRTSGGQRSFGQQRPDHLGHCHSEPHVGGRIAYPPIKLKY